MSENDCYYGQRVIWTNAAGARVEGRITNIRPGRENVEIRVKHDRGAQLLWVKPAALEPKRD